MKKKIKSNQQDAVLRTGKQPKTSKVREAKCDEAAAERCIQNQVGTNGSPKKRTNNSGGIERP